ncbi:MAG TPA: TolC family protein [bacterium]|nr:TolC family protein [bacterium]
MRHHYFVLIILIATSSLFAQELRKLTLEDCIQIALENNTKIVSAHSNANMSQANLKASRGNFMPRIDAYSGWRKRSEEWNTIRFDQLVSSKESYHYQVELSQPIFTGFGNYAALKMNQTENEKSKNVLRWTKQTVILDVKFRFYNVLKQQQLLKVAEDAVEISQGELNRIEEMERLGAASRAEVYQQKVNLGQNKLALVNAKNNLSNALTELNYTLGIDMTTEIALIPESEETLIESFDSTFEEVITEALNNRLDYKIANNELQYARSNVKYQKSGFYPTVSIFGSYNWWDVQFPQSKREIDEFDSYSFGVNLNINLFNGFKTKANVQHAQAAVISAEANLEQAKRQVVMDVKTTMLEIDKAIENIELTKENISLAEEDYKLASERFRIGAGTLLEQLTAQNTLTKAKIDLIQAIYDYKYAMTALDLAIGRLDSQPY